MLGILDGLPIDREAFLSHLKVGAAEETTYTDLVDYNGLIFLLEADSGLGLLVLFHNGRLDDARKRRKGRRLDHLGDLK